ncbi:hypothetical protein [Pontibacter anaerobius]|uniref:Uncharacterized protein n=1 Tax=Pontibacter anaerobius TaxID=2993940 RepID=A0ABT3RG83_9BACT|nr:hypothetical protein [Pontibacter anaerobius]MCX2740424.1 hypothetical protein [Pontibacter anaerobius]
MKWKTHKRRTGILRQLAEDSVQAFTTKPALTYTEEEVSISYAQNVNTVKWSDFKSYLEEEDTIYLLQEHPYLAWSFSEKEIGAAVFNLKELARQKLPLLK